MNLDTVCGHLAGLMERLEMSTREAPRDLQRAALAIEHVVMADLYTSEEEEAILAEARVAGRAARCQKTFSDLESSIERSMVEVVRLTGAEGIWAPDNVGQHYIARYESLARCEIELARMTATDRVLFIGSGYLPITAFEYARQCGCHVDCADFVPEAIDCSRRIAERLGMAERVAIHHTRGEAHDPAEYDVILVGVLAMPKPTIMRHLDSHAKKGCRVMCRTTYGLRQLIYQQAAFDARELVRLLPGERSVATGDRVISAQLLMAT